ncbi:MAG: hypothetical protein KDI13_06280 [Alphaproteobacteria bacterium]|nr:hypothetical protein [Alphaproteobacteria bacterium]
MSEVNARDLTRIESIDDIFDKYSGTGKNVKAGIEVEMAFIDPASPDLAVMTLPQNRVLKNAAAAALPGDWVHNEPTSELLEVASIAEGLNDLKGVLRDTNKKISILGQKSQGLGLKRSYFQELPDKTAAELLSRIVDVERYKIMYAPYRADMEECVRYFAVCKSTQVSVGYPDQNKALADIRRLYYLAPFLFMLTDNSAGYSEGKRFRGHAGMTLRKNGLPPLPDYVLSAKSGEEFFTRHIEHVMNNPLFMYYDLDGNLQRVPSGDWSVTFNSLKKQGLNTTSNYYLAQSLMWPDVKIAALKDEEGQVNGHRYEARMFGVGIHQHQTAFLIVSLLAFQPILAKKIDALLTSYGFRPEAPQTQDYVEKSYAAARNHNGNFFNIPFGTGTMSEFARTFADLFEPSAETLGLEEEIQPILTICRTGCTDAKVNRLLFPDMEDIIKFQRTYDTSLFEDPNQCARTIFEKEIKRLKPGCFCDNPHAA